MPPIWAPLAGLVAEKRKELCLTIREIAEATDLSTSYIEKLLRKDPQCRPKPATVAKIAKAFGISYEDGLRLAGLLGPIDDRADTDPDAFKRILEVEDALPESDRQYLLAECERLLREAGGQCETRKSAQRS